MPLRCLIVDDSDAFLAAAAAVLIAASPAAGFVAKADLSAGAIARLLGHAP